MTLPFVSRALHNAIVGRDSRFIEKLLAEISELKADLAKEREAARNAMSSALVASRLSDPYAPRKTAPVPKPLGREGATAVLRRLEAQERELLAKQKSENADSDPIASA